jgi:hypothetical protein
MFSLSARHQLTRVRPVIQFEGRGDEQEQEEEEVEEEEEEEEREVVNPDGVTSDL